uniref:Uncharacterized protein n=1 Tax=Anguilla anguilla TaxID=7936 RepID=A0A0E9PYE1_ANGAN
MNKVRVTLDYRRSLLCSGKADVTATELRSEGGKARWICDRRGRMLS